MTPIERREARGETRLRLKTENNSRHPWIFSKMVEHPPRRPPAGALVEVHDRRGSFVGRGIYHPRRTIAVRLLTRDPRERLDEEFLFRRLSEAKALREDILRIPENSDAYRLAHGEADGLSGVVIDKFADLLVVEPLAAGWLTLSRPLVAALHRLYPGCRPVFRPDPRTEKNEGVDFAGLESLYPVPPSIDIKENGMLLRVNLKTGHKTGFFLDQRENRALVASLCAGRSVLDLFCYTGGFAIAAAAAGAAEVTAVDLDEKALETAAFNASRNGVSVDFHHHNCFDFLRRTTGRRWDLVVVDPAKLAAVREEIPRALKTYNDINALALRAVRRGGLVLSCSCSGLVSEQQFIGVLFNAAGEAGVELQVLRISGAAPDHPVRSDFPESRYLKAVLARVC